MDSGKIGTQLARPGSHADMAVKPMPTAQINEKGQTQTDGSSLSAPDFAASKPPTLTRQAPLALAPLQRVTPYEKRNIAQFLTFAEAISLMLAAKDMHQAIQEDGLLRLDEVSSSFQGLGLDDNLYGIQALKAEILELERQLGPGAAVAGPPADTAKRGISFAGLSFRTRRAAKETPVQAQLREKKAQQVHLATNLETFEPAVEDVVFHFASERAKGPRARGATEQVYTPPEKIASQLHDAISKGDVQLLRAGLREFLSLPERLMPNARKLALLREPLKYFGKYRCSDFKLPERGRYEATMAYVDEIVSSQRLSPSEKREFFNKLEPLEREGRVVERDIFGYALFHNNPAMAAAILLGIHESSAVPDQPALRQSLLADIGMSWGGLGSCVDCVADMLRPYEYRAPDWVKSLTTGLRRIPAAPLLLGESKEPFGTPGY